MYYLWFMINKNVKMSFDDRQNNFRDHKFRNIVHVLFALIKNAVLINKLNYKDTNLEIVILLKKSYNFLSRYQYILNLIFKFVKE